MADEPPEQEQDEQALDRPDLRSSRTTPVPHLGQQLFPADSRS